MFSVICQPFKVYHRHRFGKGISYRRMLDFLKASHNYHRVSIVGVLIFMLIYIKIHSQIYVIAIIVRLMNLNVGATIMLGVLGGWFLQSVRLVTDIVIKVYG